MIDLRRASVLTLAFVILLAFFSSFWSVSQQVNSPKLNVTTYNIQYSTVLPRYSYIYNKTIVLAPSLSDLAYVRGSFANTQAPNYQYDGTTLFYNFSVPNTTVLNLLLWSLSRNASVITPGAYGDLLSIADSGYVEVLKYANTTLQPFPLNEKDTENYSKIMIFVKYAKDFEPPEGFQPGWSYPPSDDITLKNATIYVINRSIAYGEVNYSIVNSTVYLAQSYSSGNDNYYIYGMNFTVVANFTAGVMGATVPGYTPVHETWTQSFNYVPSGQAEKSFQATVLVPPGVPETVTATLEIDVPSVTIYRAILSPNGTVIGYDIYVYPVGPIVIPFNSEYVYYEYNVTIPFSLTVYNGTDPVTLVQSNQINKVYTARHFSSALWYTYWTSQGLVTVPFFIRTYDHINVQDYTVTRWWNVTIYITNSPTPIITGGTANNKELMKAYYLYYFIKAVSQWIYNNYDMVQNVKPVWIYNSPTSYYYLFILPMHITMNTPYGNFTFYFGNDWLELQFGLPSMYSFPVDGQLLIFNVSVNGVTTPQWGAFLNVSWYAGQVLGNYPIPVYDVAVMPFETRFDTAVPSEYFTAYYGNYGDEISMYSVLPEQWYLPVFTYDGIFVSLLTEQYALLYNTTFMLMDPSLLTSISYPPTKSFNYNWYTCYYIYNIEPNAPYNVGFFNQIWTYVSYYYYHELWLPGEPLGNMNSSVQVLNTTTINNVIWKIPQQFPIIPNAILLQYWTNFSYTNSIPEPPPWIFQNMTYNKYATIQWFYLEQNASLSHAIYEYIVHTINSSDEQFWKFEYFVLASEFTMNTFNSTYSVVNNLLELESFYENWSMVTAQVMNLSAYPETQYTTFNLLFFNVSRIPTIYNSSIFFNVTGDYEVYLADVLNGLNYKSFDKVPFGNPFYFTDPVTGKTYYFYLNSTGGSIPSVGQTLYFYYANYVPEIYYATLEYPQGTETEVTAIWNGTAWLTT